MGFRGDSGGVQKGRGKIDEADQGVGLGSRLDVSGPAGDEGHADDILVVKGAFCDETMMAVKVAVVGGENDERIVGFADGFQMVEDFADILVEHRDHAVVDRDILGEFGRVVEMRVEPVIGERSFPVGAEIGLRFLSLLDVRWSLVELPGLGLRHGDLGGVNHGVPRLGNEIRRVRIEEAGPDEKWGLISLGEIHPGVGALGDPGILMVFLRQIPVMDLRRIRGLAEAEATPLVLEIILPVGQAFLLHPERVMLADMAFVGMVAGQFDMLESVERPVKVAPEIEIA